MLSGAGRKWIIGPEDSSHSLSKQGIHSGEWKGKKRRIQLGAREDLAPVEQARAKVMEDRDVGEII